MNCKLGQLLLQMQMVQIFCITNWDKGYYKVGQVLQNWVGISKQGNFHNKVGQVLQSRAVQYLDQQLYNVKVHSLIKVLEGLLAWLISVNLVTICFQFYFEKLRFVLRFKFSNLKMTMNFEPQYVSLIICKLTEFKIIEIYIPDTPLFSHPLEN